MGKEEIYTYDDIEEYAEYELIDGWYFNLEMDRDWNGAPNPMDFIDLQALGNALTSTWDDSLHYISENGEIVTTSYGW